MNKIATTLGANPIKVFGFAGNSNNIPPGQSGIHPDHGNGNGNCSGDVGSTPPPPTGSGQKFIFYYHPDHLGSSSYITDANGEVSQHLEYYAFGETFVEEHSNTSYTPYKFNGKELDEETGLYYYSARYYDPVTGVFISVDPKTEETATPFAYCMNNPIVLKDPDGKFPVPGWVHTSLDVAGLVPGVGEIADGLNAALYAQKGDYMNAALSVAAMVPVAGAAATGAKLLKKAVKEGSEAVLKTAAKMEAKAVKAEAKAVAQTAEETVSKGTPDFVVTPDGVAVPKNQNTMRDGFDKAGFPSKRATQTTETGVIHTVPTKNGHVDVRTMEGSAKHPKRAVITHPNTNSPKTPSGKATTNKSDNHIEQH